MPKIKYQQKVFRKYSVSIAEDKNSVKVIYRCQPLKEGWWIKEFPKTDIERQKALSLFSSVRQ